MKKLKERILWDQTLRNYFAIIGSVFNKIGYSLIHISRSLVRYMNHHVTHVESDWYVYDLKNLHKDIAIVLKTQRQQYNSYSYFYNYPYQALGILGVYGERGTEERFESYGLRELISQEDNVLDIGCNCGFMALYAAFRTGCNADGIDINPYMTEIGSICAKYLRLDDRVKIFSKRIQDYDNKNKYSVVFSFATHWTDDENYRVSIREHFETCAKYLCKNGRLLFETHAADYGDEKFYSSIKNIEDIFETLSVKDTDRKSRHFYVFKKK